MPYYGIPVGQTDEDIAMSFNKTIITDLLRNKYQYDGIVCTDWGLITDAHLGNIVWPARAWGVGHLSETERVEKALDAGVDQFGGESRPELVIKLVKEGSLSKERIDVSVKRLLRQKFQLGLFDNPFVDETKVSEIARWSVALPFTFFVTEKYDFKAGISLLWQEKLESDPAEFDRLTAGLFITKGFDISSL